VTDGPDCSDKTIQVKCINKRDRLSAHERIKNIGGFTDRQWKLTEEEAIAYIKNGEWAFYTSVGGKSVWVVIATHNGSEYLKTEADGYSPDNLLSLPECP
jgi:hypothetical protein